MTAEVRALFHAGVAAWNRGDLDAYLSTYADSDDVRWTSGGRVLRGKAAIAASYRERFLAAGGSSKSAELGRLEVRDLEIEACSDTDAVVFGEWRLATRDGDARGFFTVHVRRCEGAWKILSDHAS